MIKTFKELPGFKDENESELNAIGIANVQELASALQDDGKVKEIIKGLSGVGPKTVEKWKDLVGSDSKPAKAAAKPAEEPKPKKKDVEIVETEVEIVDDDVDVYVPKAKPELDDATVDALAKRAIISGRRPAFKRQEWFRYSKLGEKWRRPKGIHSKMKRNLKRRPPVVDIGFRGPRAARYLHPSGFEEVLVHNVDGLENIDPKVQAVRIGGTVGTRKRIQIEDRAAELGIRVLNRMV
jgi:Ribosomal protein L32E